MNLPRSRNTDIVVNELGDEILIYDLNNHKAYNLNKTSSIVYQACGDGMTFEGLKRKHLFTDDLIYLALDELKESNLITDYESGKPFKGLSRREVIRKVGLATMIALPVISSLIAPRAAHAQSGAFAPGSRGFNQSCGTSTDCAAGAPNCRSVISNANDKRCCVGGGTGASSGARGEVAGIGFFGQADCNQYSYLCCSNSSTYRGNGVCICN